MKLFTVGNPKTQKGEAAGYLTAVLHLAPFDLSGKNVCPFASAGCAAACLNTAGRGGIIKRGETTNAIQEARKRKTREFFADRAGFVHQLKREIDVLARRARLNGLKLAVRLNGTSDLNWESLAPELFSWHHDVQFYDYTKNPARMMAKLPANYDLTFSRSEINDAHVRVMTAAQKRVAVVFDRLPATYKGRPVVDGDTSDLRFLDPADVVVGLKAKGKARRDVSGFVVRMDTPIGG